MKSAADVREGVSGAIVGTVVGVDEARRQIQLEPDEDRYQRLTVTTDSLSSRYYGFGGEINGSPEIYTGSTGFANIRVGDRLQVRGTGRANGILFAERVTLLGRTVEASQVGVGNTREPTSISTPTATNTVQSGAGTTSTTAAEGTVRQINLDEGRIVIQTTDRRMLNVRATRSTPVYYRSEIYRIDNLEIGDTIRVETNTRGSATDDVTARTIDVVRSVQDSASAQPADRRVTSLMGRVTRVDRTSDSIRVDDGRTEVRVDMTRAADGSGRAVHATDLRIGDSVDISGSYSGTRSDLFLASTVRFQDGGALGDTRAGTDVSVTGNRDYERGDYTVYSLSGTIVESLQTSPVLVVRDRATGRNVELFITDDFVYRTKAGSYATADKIAVGDAVLVKAFRDEDNNLIAQSLRIRP
jgi:hypothetical protein